MDMFGGMTIMWPDGVEQEVSLPRLLVQTQNAELKAKHGMFLPGVGKQHPTVRALVDEYRLPPVRTWAAVAPMMRRFYTDLSTYYREWDEHPELDTDDREFDARREDGQ